jgi:hypothetical protein
MNVDDELGRLATEVGRLVKTMPVSVIQSLAHALGGALTSGGPLDRGRIVAGVANPGHRGLAAKFLD